MADFVRKTTLDVQVGMLVYKFKLGSSISGGTSVTDVRAVLIKASDITVIP